MRRLVVGRIAAYVFISRWRRAMPRLVGWRTNMNYYIVSKLRPYLKLFDRSRGLTKTPLKQEGIKGLVGKQDPTILEIGCNDGNDTMAFLRAMPQAKIFCFEPDPRAIARFRKH